MCSVNWALKERQMNTENEEWLGHTGGQQLLPGQGIFSPQPGKDFRAPLCKETCPGAMHSPHLTQGGEKPAPALPAALLGGKGQHLVFPSQPKHCKSRTKPWLQSALLSQPRPLFKGMNQGTRMFHGNHCSSILTKMYICSLVEGKLNKAGKQSK